MGGGPEQNIIKEQTPAGTQRITCQLLVKLLPAGGQLPQQRQDQPTEQENEDTGSAGFEDLIVLPGPSRPVFLKLC